MRRTHLRRTVIATAAAVALLAATAATAVADPPEHPRAAYGKGVIVHCGAPYGQLVKASMGVPEHPKPIGAKAFITNRALAEAHGCVFGPE